MSDREGEERGGEMKDGYESAHSMCSLSRSFVVCVHAEMECKHVLKYK